jgi:hypothetical protein
MFGSILLGGSQVPNLRRLPEPNPGPLCQATLRTSVFVCPTHPWRLWNAQRPDFCIVYPHLQPVSSVEMSCNSHFGTVLVITCEAIWNMLKLRFSEFSQDLPSLWSIIEPLPSRVDPKWVSEWQMHHRGLNWYLKQHEPQAICNLWDFRIFQASSFGSFPSHQTCSIAGLLISKTSSKSGSNGGISWGNLLLRL